MRTFSLIVVVVLAVGAHLCATPARAATGPTVVLIHGAWEQGSSWSAVATRLRALGYPVVVPELPLRTLAGDAAVVAGVVKGIAGPVVLAGHSYGGAVISNAASDTSNVAALVFIAAFAPDVGESIVGLDSRVPGSLVAASLVPVPFVGPESGIDLFINPVLYRSVFAADLPEQAAADMTAAQRPLTLTALTDPAAAPAWKTIASWYLVARDDLAIPPETERFMARRANSTTVEIASSHAAAVSNPDAVTELIVDAARSAATVAAPVAAVTSLRLSPSSFETTRSARVSYSLNVPASVRFNVQRSVAGRSAGGRCAAPTASNRGGRRCARFVAVRGGFTRSRPAGADRFRFTGALRPHAGAGSLPPRRDADRRRPSGCARPRALPHRRLRRSQSLAGASP